ncbi:Trigger factor [Deinococcus proteolyticus MRP]|uniref:Trigger factor n=1 Tax=Deinococcus proteolyticus (strain ATCC 35074 / DSM 20540 / JCM 6276 / NBRC 101906 / NCIMB 13154 / VKM Ac-1939 / CCM 2703 / MRP) TaxID=693977 RepID=F0RLK8_DEIPM|nr:trigger factor [Deinococcus proteolyticus]ADY26932.1 Trigger factor [Deinococcus proteolyticus MRP]
MAELIKKEGHQVEFKVEVPANEVNSAFDAVWKGLAQQVRVPGFRPGKAPRRVIEKRVGEGYVESEVQNRLVNAHFPQAVRELELSLVDANIEPQDVKSGETFSFTVKGDLYPEVTLSDWSGLSLSAAAPEITDEVVDRTLADMQERAASFEQVERAIEATDQVTVEEEGEEGSYPIYMDMAGEHIQQALLGKNVGDEVEISVPAQEGEDDTPVKVKVLGIKSKTLPELNDDFAGTMQFENMDKLRSTLREELERRAQGEGDNARREEFLSALIEGMTVDIPQSLLQRRQDDLMNEIKNDLSRQGVRWSEYESFMQEQGKLDEFMQELGKNAEQRVKRDLALGKLAEDLKVQVTDQEFGQNLMAMAQMSGMSPQELQSQMGAGGLNAFYTDILRSKALNQALAQLSGEGQESKTEEAKAESSDSQETAEGQTAEQGEQSSEE